jgi:NAD(P)-dependent dehydrogenase (short-subunit alcohol dehydrogenase family)
MEWTLVTGASMGLGEAVAIRLAKEGHHLLLQSKSKAISCAESCRSFGVEVETVTVDFLSDINPFLQKLSSCNVTCLVNNASLYLAKPPSQTTKEEWQSLFQVNFHSPNLLVQACLPTLKSTVSIGVAGLNRNGANTYCSAYAASKQALLTSTKDFAKEFAKQKIRFNMVSPGHLENSTDLPPDLPMGRAASFDETAELICYLLSSKGEYITGQNIEIAGGFAL